MPKSKLKWHRITGRVGPAWDNNIDELVKHVYVPKGFKFHEIEWKGKEYTIIFVSGH